MIVLLRSCLKSIYRVLMGALFLAVTSSTYSCGDDRRTRALTARKDSTMAVLFTLTAEKANENRIIDSLELIKKDLEVQYKIIKDTALGVERENPMAAAYIHTFDRYPIDILEQVLTELQEDNSGPLFMRGVLMIYGKDSSAHINDVRSQFNRLDEATKKIADKTAILNRGIERHHATLLTQMEALADLRVLHEEITRELEDLKN